MSNDIALFTGILFFILVPLLLLVGIIFPFFRKRWSTVKKACVAIPLSILPAVIFQQPTFLFIFMSVIIGLIICACNEQR